MVHLSLKNIKKYYGGNLILKNISFDILMGEKVGIIGRNGTGKTTLFKLIKQIEKQDEGNIAIKKDTTIGYLDQIPVFPKGFKVQDVLNTAFEEEFKLLKEMKKLELTMSEATSPTLEKILAKYGELQQQFTCIGGYDMEEKLSKVCEGLKISDPMRERIFDTLSGGEKTTILLGKILLQSCDLLLLDEPSNHLDMDSIEWLEDYLKDSSGTVLIISHDRYFLDKTVSKVIEMEDGECEAYLGNYSYYVEEKNKRYLLALNDYENQQKKIKAMEESIKRFKDWGSRADNPKMFKKAASVQKRLDKLERLKRPVLEQKKMQIDFSTNDSSGKNVIRVSKVRKSFGDRVILGDLDFHLRLKEKVAILGRNGSGKSTLFKMIIGEYPPDRGEILVGSNSKIGYLQQNLSFPDEDATVLETFQYSCNLTEGEARNILARFLFYGEDVFKRVSSLSGGERSRLRLCQLMHQDINTLVLDEPTNHLDIESREMLEETLEEFDGTIVFISHDRYFINSLAEKVYELRDQKLYEFGGNYDYYRMKRLEVFASTSASPKEKEARIINSTSQTSAKTSTKTAIKITPNSKPAKRNEYAINRLEETISRLEAELDQIDQEINRNASDYVAVQELQQSKDQLQNDLDTLLEKWMELNSVE